MFVQESADSVDTKLPILKCPITNMQERPSIITPPGPSKERQSYLFQNVRPNIRPMNQNELCPRPTEELAYFLEETILDKTCSFFWDELNNYVNNL